MKLSRPITIVALAVTVTLGFLWFAASSPSRAQTDQGVLASLISRLLSTPATRVSIGSIEGALSSSAVIRDVRISDRNGVWLSLDRARLVWTRTALLRGRLEVNELQIDRLELARKPVTTEEEEVTVSDEPILPELPVKVIVEKFSLQELFLGEPMLGTAARLSAQGSANIGDPNEGLELDFAAQRLDAPGRLAIKLDYVPQTNRLALDLVHQEPAGGIAARLLDLPGLPPVDLRLAGEGPLSNFGARLDFSAGASIGATGTTNVRRGGAGYAIAANLAARIEGLLPAPVAPVFSGTTQLVGNVAIGDDGTLRFEPVRITSNVASFDVAGRISGSQGLDLTLQARALPNDGSATRAGDAQIERLLFDGRVQGTMTAPRINGSLDAAGVRLPEGTLDTLSARIAMNPINDVAIPDRFAFVLDAKAAGLKPSDRALARALGQTLSLTASGTFARDGIASVDTARLETSTAKAGFTGRVASTLIDGDLDAEIPSLAAFSGITGRTLRGSASLKAALSGNPSKADIIAAIDADVRDLATGTPPLDGLLGRSVAANGIVRRVPGGFAFENFRVDGAHLDARVDGRATQTAANLGLDLTIDELKRVDARISAGRASVTARLAGSLEKPDVTAKATLADIRALDRPIPRLVLTLDAKDVTGALDAALNLEGQVGTKPARGTVHLARPSDGSWLLDRLDVDVGSVSLDGDLRIGSDQMAEGRISLSGGNLDDLSPLVLTKLGGSVEADILLNAADGRQDLSITAKGARASVADVTARDFDARITVSDLYAHPLIDGNVQAAEVRAGGQTFTTVRLSADGTPEASRITASAVGQGFDLNAQASVVPGDGTRIDLASFTARRGRRRLTLAQPATISLQGGSAAIRGLVIAADQGRVAVSGTVGDRLDLSLEIRNLPLQVAEIAMPNFGVTGTANGNVTIKGEANKPNGSYDLKIAGLSTSETRQAGLPPLTVTAQGQIADQHASTDADIAAGRFGALKVTGRIPLDAADDLSLRIGGRTDLAVANTFLSAAGRRVTGSATLELSVAGTITEPQVQGTVALSGGSFVDSLQGIQLNDIAGRFAARGQTLTIESLSARTPNGGSLTAQGRIGIDPAAGLPAEIRVTANRAQLVSNETVEASADMDLAVSGPLMSRPRVAGRVNILTMNVSVPDRLPATVRPLPGTRHIQPPPAAAARLALARKQQATRAKRRPFSADLDLTIMAQNRIFVRGRGINAELGGDLRLQGTSRDPVAIGAFELRRGRLDLIGRRIDLVRGRLDFTGDLTPSLDLLAETQAGDVTARIAVTGPASQPEFAFSSSPDLPQDEVLSRVLFQRPSGALSAGQALQLAQTVAQLSGGTGSDAFESLRRSLGVDSLDITVDSSGGPAVGVGRYISDNVRVGVKAGARPEESGVTVDVDLTRRLKAQGAVDAGGGTSVGLGFEMEY